MDVWAGWLERATQCNEYVVPEREPYQPRTKGKPAGEESPGTDFNRRGSWDETGLFEAGWAWERRAEPERGLVRRPGKDAGVSASVGVVTSKENGWPLFWCWSSSVDEFVPEHGYSRFSVYTILNHAGDFSAAAKALAARGYGGRMPAVGDLTLDGTPGQPAAPPQGEPGDGRIFRWMSELTHRPENDKWLWHGFVSRGGVTLFNALWKAGKSTLLSHLIRAFDGRHTEFLGREITPARVLYVSEEHQDIWAERRDELNIGDHVGIMTREHLPFRGRSSPAQWVQLVADIIKAVQQYHFDVVIVDTLSKIWPVREENDAGQVEDALMPLWGITNTQAAMVVVHHNRKSGGKDFTGARGSGGLPAFAETIVEFSPNSDDRKDCKRLLNSGGRYRETPTKWLIELTPAGYVGHGDPDDMTPDMKATLGVGDQENANDWKVRVLAMIPDTSGAAMTVEEMQEGLYEQGRAKGVRRKDVLEWLEARTEDGELLRLGRGAKGSPYRWYKPAECGSDPRGCESGTESGTESDEGEAVGD
jgi:hypothetical protein